jgi:hypothetical protein
MSAGVRDISGNNLPFTSTGCYAAAGQAKFGTSALVTAWGSTSNTQTPAVSGFNFGSGQFTIEGWAYWASHNATRYEVLMCQSGSSGSNQGWWLGMTNAGNLLFQYSTTGTNWLTVQAAYTPTLNSWTHVAADRDASGVIRVYANGVVIASTTDTSALYASTAAMYIGDFNTSTIPGNIDEIRVSIVSRYGGAFTPPSSAFTTDANTVLLVDFEPLAGASVGKRLSGQQPAFEINPPSPPNIVQVGKAPTPGPHTVSGTAYVNGVATAGIIVRAYAKATGELLGQATTGAGGAYSINCGVDWADVYVTAFDPTTFQAIVFDEVVPG